MKKKQKKINIHQIFNAALRNCGNRSSGASRMYKKKRVATGVSCSDKAKLCLILRSLTFTIFEAGRENYEFVCGHFEEN